MQLTFDNESMMVPDGTTYKEGTSRGRKTISLKFPGIDAVIIFWPEDGMFSTSSIWKALFKIPTLGWKTLKNAADDELVTFPN